MLNKGAEAPDSSVPELKVKAVESEVKKGVDGRIFGTEIETIANSSSTQKSPPPGRPSVAPRPTKNLEWFVASDDARRAAVVAEGTRYWDDSSQRRWYHRSEQGGRFILTSS